MKGRSLALPSTTGLAALTSSDDEDTSTKEEEMMSNDYEDLEHHSKSMTTTMPSENSFNQKRILANIAQRKKLATPAPSTKDHETNSRSSLVDESLYSSVSNDVYTKISDNVTASVIEVIEPTASEEEEFKQALKEMNWTGGPTSPVLHSARPVQVRSPSNSSKASPRDSIRSRYSSNGELSPTKRLMEMGIQEGVLRQSSAQSSPSPRKSSNFLQKIASKTKLIKRSPPLHAGMYANLDDHALEQAAAEEHILPDSFDEVNDIDIDGVQVVSGQKSKSSVSPSSRKSASSHASRGSQDSGIGIPVQRSNQDHQKIVPKARQPTLMHSAKATTTETERNNNNSKAWYDVPSDDETEAPEADSLASIISHRGSSEDEN